MANNAMSHHESLCSACSCCLPVRMIDLRYRLPLLGLNMQRLLTHHHAVSAGAHVVRSKRQTAQALPELGCHLGCGEKKELLWHSSRLVGSCSVAVFAAEIISWSFPMQWNRASRNLNQHDRLAARCVTV